MIAFTRKVAEHQAEHGFGVSIENPRTSNLVRRPEIIAFCGSPATPKPGWSFYQSDGCQLQVVYPGDDNPGQPIQKSTYWIANFDLSSLELRCRHPNALMGSTHEHKHARGTMKVQGKTASVAEHTGRYSSALGALYGKCVRSFCEQTSRPDKKLETALTRLAQEAEQLFYRFTRLPL